MSDRLTSVQRVAYAAPALFLAVVALPLNVFVPQFYSDVVGVRMETVGQIMLAAMVLDAISDPLAGWFSDSVRTRWGRRRLFLVLGSAPLAACVYFLFTPPVGSGAGWFTAAIVPVYLLWTLVVVPYEALGIEITQDYDERTSLLGLRETLALLGVLLALATPAAIGWALGSGSGGLASGEDGVAEMVAGERDKYRLFALLYAPPIVLVCWWCARRVHEPRAVGARTPVSLTALWRDTLANRPFVVLTCAYTGTTMAAQLGGALTLYYVKYVIKSEQAELFLVLYILVAILTVPFWTRLAKRFEKVVAWRVALIWNAVVFAMLFFLGEGDELAYAGLLMLAGVPFGGLLVLPAAMQGDAVDFGEALSRARREGLYVGLWNVARKLAGAAGVGLALWILGRQGYSANMQQAPDVQLTLRVLYSLAPAGLTLVALVLSRWYIIDRAKHGQTRETISDHSKQGPD